VLSSGARDTEGALFGLAERAPLKQRSLQRGQPLARQASCDARINNNWRSAQGLLPVSRGLTRRRLSRNTRSRERAHDKSARRVGWSWLGGLAFSIRGNQSS
jgi:hypothetical protein